jgi:cellulose synthase/poly-beta-1,6-N-acetylglucosamine synthase-like glycosyltransferase
MTRENTNCTGDRLTVVVPSKNEGINLYFTLMHLNNQRGIRGTRVVVADSSTETSSKHWLLNAQTNLKNLRIERTEGGYPAKARLEGSKRVTTELVLFLDADMWLQEEGIIERTIREVSKADRDLVTTTVETDAPYNWVYRLFYLSQLFSQWVLRSPFAIGGFQLWRTDAYWKAGGYNAEELFAEDYSISRRVEPERFRVIRVDGVYTSARRFKKKGVMWMMAVMLKSYVHRKDPQFFKRSHGYWD